MDVTTGGVWSDTQIQLHKESDPSTFSGTFETSPQSSFLDTSYSAASSTPSFAQSSETYSHTNSTNGSYDSQHIPDLSGRQYYDTSGMTGSILSEVLRSNSLTSLNSNLGTLGQEGLAEGLSPKASLGSMQEAGNFHNTLVQSPEYEESSATIGWKPASMAVVQATPSYNFRYADGTAILPNNTTNPAACYSTEQINAAGPSHVIHPFGYPNAEAVHVMAQGNATSSLPMSGMNAIDSFQQSLTPAPSSLNISAPALIGFTTQGTSSTTVDLQAQGPKKSGGPSRGNTSGSTRRAKFQRSRTGCMVCRKRKVKCDQDGQPCKQCRIGKRECHYEENPTKRKRKTKNEEESIAQRKGKASEEEDDEMDAGGEGGSLFVPGSLKTHSEGSTASLAYTKEEVEVGNPGANATGTSQAAAEGLRRTTDALFAQHTLLDQVGLEDEGKGEHPKVEDSLDSFEASDQLDSFSLQYTNDDSSTDSIEPWTTGAMTEDWTISTPSSAPSSHKTGDGDNIGDISFQNVLSEGAPVGIHFDGRAGMDSPFAVHAGLKEGNEGDIIAIEAGSEDVPWYATNQSDSGMGIGLGLEGGEICLLSQET